MKNTVTIYHPAVSGCESWFERYENVPCVEVENGLLSFWTSEEKKVSIETNLPFYVEHRLKEQP